MKTGDIYQDVVNPYLGILFSLIMFIVFVLCVSDIIPTTIAGPEYEPLLNALVNEFLGKPLFGIIVISITIYNFLLLDKKRRKDRGLGLVIDEQRWVSKVSIEQQIETIDR